MEAESTGLCDYDYVEQINKPNIFRNCVSYIIRVQCSSISKLSIRFVWKFKGNKKNQVVNEASF